MNAAFYLLLGIVTITAILRGGGGAVGG